MVSGAISAAKICAGYYKPPCKPRKKADFTSAFFVLLNAALPTLCPIKNQLENKRRFSNYLEHVLI